MEYQLAESVALVHDFTSGRRELGDTISAMADLVALALGTDMCGVTLFDAHGRPRTVAYTQTTVPEVDETQFEVDAGPCLDAARQTRTNQIEDTATDDRWPEFCAAAAAAGVRSTLSAPILVGDRGAGALNIYFREPGSRDSVSIRTAELLARQTAIVSAYYDKAGLAHHLERAMQSRATIEQAKGVIMATAGCVPDVAFDILRQQSQTENRKINEIAAEIVNRQSRRARA
jgi:transcriptional regulator with GAF, ATPase, and Fis domain